MIKTDKLRCRAHCDRVLAPFVDSQHADVHDDWQEGDPIEDDVHVVGWCDGDLAQLATVTEETTVDVCKEKRICTNKQSAARSATEQGADLPKVFKSHHFLQKVTTMTSVDFQ